MKTEEKARKDIDTLLSFAGWAVQNRDEIKLGANVGLLSVSIPLILDLSITIYSLIVRLLG